MNMFRGAACIIGLCMTPAWAGLIWDDPDWNVQFPVFMDQGTGSKLAGFGDVAADVAVASARALASQDTVNSIYTAEVDFDRNFSLKGSPAGWIVTLQAVVAGSLKVLGNDNAAARYETSANVKDNNGGNDQGMALLTLDPGQTQDTNGTNGIFLNPSISMILPDGHYTADGSLETKAFVFVDPMPAVAQSLFFNGGLAVSVSASPIPEPASCLLAAFGMGTVMLAALARRLQRPQRERPDESGRGRHKCPRHI
jgi:hypothetical protein